MPTLSLNQLSPLLLLSCWLILIKLLWRTTLTLMLMMIITYIILKGVTFLEFVWNRERLTPVFKNDKCLCLSYSFRWLMIGFNCHNTAQVGMVFFAWCFRSSRACHMCLLFLFLPVQSLLTRFRSSLTRFADFVSLSSLITLFQTVRLFYVSLHSQQ